MKTHFFFLILFTLECAAQTQIVATQTKFCPKKDTVILTTLDSPSQSKYQWYRNNIAIKGANFKSYSTNLKGKYHAEVKPSNLQSLSPSPTMLYVNDIFFLNENLGWAVGVHGKTIKTIDGGDTWQEFDIEPQENEDLVAVAFANQMEGYILGNKMYYTKDGGINWKVLTNFPEQSNGGVDRGRIQIVDRQNIFVKGYFINLIQSNDAGKTWEKIKIPYGIITGFAFKNANEGIIVGNFGNNKEYIYQTKDSGNTWKKVYETTNGSIRYANYTQNNTYYVNNIDKPILLKSTDGGDNWSEIRVTNTTSPLAEINNLHFIDEKSGVIVNSWGRVYRTLDGAANWEFLGEKSPNLSSLFMLNKEKTILWKYGESTIWRNEGLKNFTNLNIPFKKRGFLFNQVKSINNSIWITSRYGDDFTFTNDKGKTWSQTKGLSYLWTNRISFINDSTGWYLADGSSVFQWQQINKLNFTKDGGKSWTLLPAFPKLPNFARLKDITFINANEGWICGEKGVILYSNDAGNSWKIQLNEGNEAFQRIFFLDNQNGWALGPNSIFKTFDGGKNWRKVHILSYPIQNYGYSIDIFFLDKNNGWVCGGQYPLFTKDGGESWEIVLNSSLALGKAIQFTTPYDGILANSSLWTTSDGGKNWELTGRFFRGADFEINEKDVYVVDEYNEIKNYVPDPLTKKLNVLKIKKKCFLQCWCNHKN